MKYSSAFHFKKKYICLINKCCNVDVSINGVSLRKLSKLSQNFTQKLLGLLHRLVLYSKVGI